MKWDVYKLLSKEEKEEYNFKFPIDYFDMPFGKNVYLGFIGFFLILTTQMILLTQHSERIAVLLNPLSLGILKLIIVMAILDCVYLVFTSAVETKWIKKHIKVVHR